MKKFLLMVCAAALLAGCATPAPTSRAETVSLPAPRASNALPPQSRSRTTEEIARLAEDSAPQPVPAEPTDPLLAILSRYSPDAFYLVSRTDPMPSAISIGGQVVLSGPFRKYGDERGGCSADR